MNPRVLLAIIALLIVWNVSQRYYTRVTTETELLLLQQCNELVKGGAVLPAPK